MNAVPGKSNSHISEILNVYDEFKMKQSNLLRSLTKGSYLKKKKGGKEKV